MSVEQNMSYTEFINLDAFDQRQHIMYQMLAWQEDQFWSTPHIGALGAKMRHLGRLIGMDTSAVRRQAEQDVEDYLEGLVHNAEYIGTAADDGPYGRVS